MQSTPSPPTLLTLRTLNAIPPLSTLKALNPLCTILLLKTLNPCTHFHVSQLEDPEPPTQFHASHLEDFDPLTHTSHVGGPWGTGTQYTRPHTSHLEDLDRHLVDAPQHSPVHGSEPPCPQQLLSAVGVPTQLQISRLQHIGGAQSAENACGTDPWRSRVESRSSCVVTHIPSGSAQWFALSTLRIHWSQAQNPAGHFRHLTPHPPAVASSSACCSPLRGGRGDEEGLGGSSGGRCDAFATAAAVAVATVERREPSATAPRLPCCCTSTACCGGDRPA